MSSGHDSIAGLRVGRFDVLERIGSGAVGSVYRARDSWDGSMVAVKILSKEFAAKATAVKRFEREAAVVRRLKHPRIVSAIELGRESELVYLAMELIPGESLEARLARAGAMSPEQVAEIGLQIADALAAAHAAGIVHRDLKPANVMLIGDASVKIVDFGVASGYEGEAGQPSTRLTQEGFTVGTPAYMAPEQFSSAEVGPEADLYSLGLILYEMLVGMAAFTGTLREIIVAQMTLMPPALPAYGGLSELIERLVAKQPEQRPQEAARVREELREIASGLQRTHWASEPADISGLSKVITDRAPLVDANDRTQPIEPVAQAPAGMDITLPMHAPPPWFPGAAPRVQSAPGLAEAKTDISQEFGDESSGQLVLPVEELPPSHSSYEHLRAQLLRPLVDLRTERRLVGAALVVLFSALVAASVLFLRDKSRSIVVQPSLVEITPIPQPTLSAVPPPPSPSPSTRSSTKPWSMELEP